MCDQPEVTIDQKNSAECEKMRFTRGGWYLFASLVCLLIVGLIAFAELFRCSGDCEGTSKNDVIVVVVEFGVTIRGDGNRNFADGETPCSRRCGNDVITGTAASDFLLGDDGVGGVRNTGRDVIYGRGGHDTINGESGNDQL